MQATTILRPGRATQTDTCGFISGSNLLTMEGDLPVDHLCIGDRVITRDTGVAVLKGITFVDITTPTIRIKPGSLGHTRPDREAEVLPYTRLLVRDWRAPALYGMKDALIPARRLIDGSFVTSRTAQKHRVYRLTFETGHIVYADGLEVSTT